MKAHGDIYDMRPLEKIAAGLFVSGMTIIAFGLLLEVLQVMRSAWPSIVMGLGFIGLAVFLDGYKGSRFG